MPTQRKTAKHNKTNKNNSAPVNVFADRPYQSNCLETIEKKGNGKYLIVLATGLGKTYIFTHMKRHGRTLILSHRDELVHQPERYYQGVCSFGVEKADEFSNGEDVVSASVQTLSKNTRLQRFSPNDFDTIIIDEAHHAAAPSYRKILDFFTGAKRRLGFTATPRRGDGVGLSEVFDEIIFSRDLKWGIKNNYLCRIQGKEIVADYDLKKVSKTAGDYNQAQLDRLQKQSGTLPAVAKAYVEQCHKAKRHTLIYCVTKDICVILRDTIQKLLPKNDRNTISVLTGETPDDERKKILAEFTDGKIRCIINCMVLTEGTDLPICDAIINLRATCNASLYQQIVGRGTRLYPGKERCLVFDVVPQGRTANRNLCTAPTLFGIEPTLLDDETKQELNQATDLLEFCEELSNTFAKAAKIAKYKLRSITVFLDERQNIFDQNRGRGMKSLAQDYLAFLEEHRDPDMEQKFGKLDISIQAEEDRYYKITPTWNSAIYISKPDVLGNVTVTLENIENAFFSDCPDDESLTGTMKLKDAIAFVKHYCKLQESVYRYAWDRKTQDAWLNAEPTGFQISALRQMYSDKDIGWQGLDELNKLEASKLIDLAKAMQKNEEEKAELTLETDGNVSVSEKAQQNETPKDNDVRFERLLNIIRNTRKEDFTDEKRAEQQLRHPDLDKYRSVEVHVVCKTKSNTAAKKKKKAYFIALLADAYENENVFNGLVVNSLTSREASLLIAFLQNILRNPLHAPGHRIYIDVPLILHKFERFQGSTANCQFPYVFQDEADSSQIKDIS